MGEERRIIEENKLIADFQHGDHEGTIAEVAIWWKIGTHGPFEISNHWDDQKAAEYRVGEAEVIMAEAENSKFFGHKKYSHDEVIGLIRKVENRLKKRFEAIVLSKSNLKVFERGQSKPVEI